jgi:hypothetical protein
LHEFDASDPVLLSHATSYQSMPRLQLDILLSSLKLFYQHIDELPIAMAYLFLHSQTFSRNQVIGRLLSEPGRDEGLTLTELSPEQPIVLGIMLRTRMINMGLEELSLSLSEACFSMVLQRLWLLYSTPPQHHVPIILALTICLVYYWGRPVHSLGFLQPLETSMTRITTRERADE